MAILSKLKDGIQQLALNKRKGIKMSEIFDDLQDLTLQPLQIKYYSLLLQGQVSSGKSFLAASAATEKRPILYFSFDKPQSGLQLHPKRQYLKIFDFLEPPSKQGAPTKPAAWNNFMMLIGMLEYKKQQGKLNPAYWFVLDSLKFVEQASLNQALWDTTSGRKTVKFAGTEIYIPSGWDSYVTSNRYLSVALDRLMCLGNLIVTAHERPEEDPTSKNKEKRERLTGKYTLDPPRVNELKAKFLDKYRVDAIGTNSWRLYTATDENFDGAFTIGAAKNASAPDLSAILDKIES